MLDHAETTRASFLPLLAGVFEFCSGTNNKLATVKPNQRLTNTSAPLTNRNDEDMAHAEQKPTECSDYRRKDKIILLTRARLTEPWQE